MEKVASACKNSRMENRATSRHLPVFPLLPVILRIQALTDRIITVQTVPSFQVQNLLYFRKRSANLGNILHILHHRVGATLDTSLRQFRGFPPANLE